MATHPRALIDLEAVASNWRTLDAFNSGSETGAVVKADAYGHGIEHVGRALRDAGCESFFVAHVREGTRLRAAIGAAPGIYVFHGAVIEEADACRRCRLIPVLNTFEQIRVYLAELAGAVPAAVHIDTGMNRLGLKPSAVEPAARLLKDAEVALVMSHFACADAPNDPMNATQKARFEAAAAAHWPGARRSMANSAGLYLGKAGYDLARPGIALYGGGPVPPHGVALAPAMRLEAPVLSMFETAAGETTGYGATRGFDRPRRLATVAFGYADGLPRSASNAGFAEIEGARAPIVGRVSMDLCTLDVTDLDHVAPGAGAVFWGPSPGLEEQASAAKTLGYELVTGLGERVERIWRG